MEEDERSRYLGASSWWVWKHGPANLLFWGYELSMPVCCTNVGKIVTVVDHFSLAPSFRRSATIIIIMGNEASIVASAMQAKSKMSQALDNVDKQFQGQPVPKNNKNYDKVHEDRERE
jgi:hypothetical protein